jgi:hypothetical protein
MDVGAGICCNVCMLATEARRRGGVSRAARLTPLERAVAAMRAARGRWSRTTPAERQAIGRRLVEARRRRVPLMAASEWVAQQPPQACDRCGSLDVRPYRAHPLETHKAPLWRCRRHATAPAASYVCLAYRRPVEMSRSGRS